MFILSGKKYMSRGTYLPDVLTLFFKEGTYPQLNPNHVTTRKNNGYLRCWAHIKNWYAL
jgi:hypothetical protein